MSGRIKKESTPSGKCQVFQSGTKLLICDGATLEVEKGAIMKGVKLGGKSKDTPKPIPVVGYCQDVDSLVTCYNSLLDSLAEAGYITIDKGE